MQRRKGLFKTIGDTAKGTLDESARTIQASLRSVRYGATNIELAMKESVVGAVEDLQVAKAESVQRMISAGVKKIDAEAMIAEHL